MSSMLKNILATIVYYDILGYPLTSFEIWKYLMSCSIKHGAYNNGEKISLRDIIKELENAEIKKHLDECQGFYFIKGRKKLVGQRIERNKISEKKVKIIKRFMQFLRFIPFVRMVAVTGRIAMKSAERESDLDLLVVLKKNYIFTGRMLVTLLAHFLGIRRHGNKIKDRICLNYFMTDENLKSGLDDLFLSSENSSALHLFASSEYSFIYPIFGWKIFQQFQEENKWIGNYRTNYRCDEIASLKLINDSIFSEIVRKMGEFIFGFSFIENILRKWQMKRIIKDPRTHQAGSFVTANNRELIFLPEPQGPKIEAIYLEKLNNFS